MKAYPFRVIMALAATFYLLAAIPALAATLSLQATIDGNNEATVFPVGSPLYLNIVVDDSFGIAGVAFTVTYDAAYVTPPDINAEGLPVNASDVSSSFPFVYQGPPETDTFRANGATVGKIYLSGAAIDQSTGGAPNIAGVDAVLFTIKFMVKSAAPIGSFNFGLEQTQLFNPAAGYGTDVGNDGSYDEGVDSKDPVPVLVGALANTDGNFGGDLSDDFPPIISAFNTPLEVESSTGWSISGTVSYNGPQAGTLKVAAFETTDTNFTNPIGGQDIVWASGNTSKPFTVSVPNGSYKLGAYIDSNANTTADAVEASGEYIAQAIAIANANDTTDRNFSLTDPVDGGTGDPLFYENWKASNGWSAIGTASADFDKDGYPNIQELLNGTDPTSQDDAGGTGYDQSTDNRVAPCTPITGNQYTMIVNGTATAEGNPVAVNDWIYAFGPGGIQSDCRAAMQVSTAGQYFLTLRGNQPSGETISFGMRQDADLKTLTSTDTVEFISDTNLPDKILTFSSTRTQNIDLIEGWNWISFNVLPDDTSLQGFFGADLDKLEQVKTQTSSVLNNVGGGNWIGDDLNIMAKIGEYQMFKVKVKTGQAFTLTVTGPPIDPQASISLQLGWSWIAYLPNHTLATGDGVSSIYADLNQVKSQTQSKFKLNESTFLGDLENMEAGKGYTIKMDSAGIMVYPAQP